jgi:hypothetical protein
MDAGADETFNLAFGTVHVMVLFAMFHAPVMSS